jgi:hypothetical protein
MVRPYAVLKLDKRILNVIAFARHVVQSRSGVRECSADGPLRRETRRVRLAILRSLGPVDGACRDDAREHSNRLADSGELLPLSSESAHANGNW